MSVVFPRTDYYKLLQVDPQAHPEIVRAAYRTLLRVLGKHPDLGGSQADATMIIEAYRTLGDPDRRRAYDQWLAAHSSVPAPLVAIAPAATNWIRIALPDHRLTLTAPFARSFDLVLEGPRPFAPRLYVKRYPAIGRASWATIGILCRAIAVARPGPMPSTDMVLLVTGELEDREAFLREMRRHTARWAWNRMFVCVCTLAPAAIHTPGLLLAPRIVRRLRAALPAVLETRRPSRTASA